MLVEDAGIDDTSKSILEYRILESRMLAKDIGL